MTIDKDQELVHAFVRDIGQMAADDLLEENKVGVDRAFRCHGMASNLSVTGYPGWVIFQLQKAYLRLNLEKQP